MGVGRYKRQRRQREAFAEAELGWFRTQRECYRDHYLTRADLTFVLFQAAIRPLAKEYVANNTESWGAYIQAARRMPSKEAWIKRFRDAVS